MQEEKYVCGIFDLDFDGSGRVSGCFLRDPERLGSVRLREGTLLEVKLGGGWEKVLLLYLPTKGWQLSDVRLNLEGFMGYKMRISTSYFNKANNI